MHRFELNKFVSFCMLLTSLYGIGTAATKDFIVVAKSGTKDFSTIQEAISSIPANNSKNVTILVKNGTYEEHIVIDKSFISLIGESREKTIIQFKIERKEWESKNGSSKGCAVINIGCSKDFKKATSPVTDIVIGNLTVENTHPIDSLKTMVIKDESNSNRVYVVNCNVWCKGHDTISLWAGQKQAEAMYYHAYCSFKGSIDAVCPRGYCYAVGCDFYETRGSAPLWHEVTKNTTQKFVVRTGNFEPAEGNTSSFKLLNSNNSSSLGTRFLILDCVFSPKVNKVGPHTEAYFYNCKGGSNDSLLVNNLSKFSGSPTQNQITAKWTFDNKWDPENAMPSVLPFAALPQPWNKAYDIPSNVELKWINGRSADKHAVFFGKDNNPKFVKVQTENKYKPENLEKGTYYWRVDAISGSDTVKGAVWSFTVGVTVPVIEQQSGIANKQTFGAVQDTKGILKLFYTLENNNSVIIKLFNLQGKELVSLPVVNRNAGFYTESLHVGKYGISSGRYIARFNAGLISKNVEVVLK